MYSPGTTKSYPMTVMHVYYCSINSISSITILVQATLSTSASLCHDQVWLLRMYMYLAVLSTAVVLSKARRAISALHACLYAMADAAPSD